MLYPLPHLPRLGHTMDRSHTETSHYGSDGVKVIQVMAMLQK